MEKLSYKLDVFEGPLDLLLYLISKNKLNIRDIELHILIEQYLAQIEQMQSQDMDIASEFLEMAARLIYLKTVSLLPRQEEAEQLKAELTGELIEYEQCRRIAAMLSEMTEGFDTFIKTEENIEFDRTYMLIHEPDRLREAYAAAIGHGQRREPPKTEVFGRIVAKKVVSVSTKIVFVLRNLWRAGRKKITSLYQTAQSRSELVATFLAVLELCKADRVRVEGSGADMDIVIIKGRVDRESK